MRRLVPALVILASLVLAAAGGAIAARSTPHLKIKGAARESGGKLQGWFTVENTGSSKAAGSTATVKLRGAPENSKVLGVSTVQHASIPALAPGDKQRVKVKATIPKKARSGNWSILACATRCVQIGRLSGTGPNRKKASAPNAPAAPPATATPGPPAPTPTPVCAPSSGPLAYPVEEPFRHVGECRDEYFGFVPASYDPSTPMPLLVWLHGCGGEAEGDAWMVGSYEGEEQPGWLTLSLGGRDGACWNPLAETEPLVLAALADFEAHFNVDTHRVILAGYSSGGDLAYRTGFFHSSTFAGLLIVNSAPFRDTEATQAELLGAATTKFHIVHLAHEEDETYKLPEVQAEVKAVKEAGFPIELIERPGEHWNEPGDVVEGHHVPGTAADIRTYLLPHIDDGWLSP